MINKSNCNVACQTGEKDEILGSLSNHDDDGNKNPTDLHI